MRATGFGSVAGNFPCVCGEVDLVPCGVSDFAASGGCQGQDLERGDGRPMSLRCFDGFDGSADVAVVQCAHVVASGAVLA